MYNFKRLLVCLDRSELDKTLIDSAAAYANFGKTVDIFFVTVVKSLQIPDSVNKDFPNLAATFVEDLKLEMQENIQQRFQDIDCNFHFNVLEGNPTKQIINWSKAKEIDLVILGKKHQHSGKGVTSRNIVNIVHCSALFIPEDSDIITKKILIPVDYSEASNVAFFKALELSRVLGVPLTCLHAYEVPSGYHTTGKSFEEFADIICHHSKTDFEQFLKEENISLSELGVEYVLDKHGDPGKIISEYATANQFDMVIIGSKGRTALSSVLLGSVAVKMVESNLNVPIMVIKTEEANLSLIEAILRL